MRSQICYFHLQNIQKQSLAKHKQKRQKKYYKLEKNEDQKNFNTSLELEGNGFLGSTSLQVLTTMFKK